MKKVVVLFFIILSICNFSELAFSQTYFEQSKKCAEILEGVTIGDSVFYAKLEQKNKCLVGLKAPHFKATTIDGLSIDSDSLKGKVLLLNFWFTKCVPCVHEIPNLNKLVSKYKDKDILFLSLANEDSQKLIEFLKSTKFKFQHIPDASKILIETFRLFSIWPTTVIIDKQGFIQFIKVGELINTKDHHKDLLDKLLSY